MDNFCGSQFWDWNKTWNSNDPDFTTCFEETVLLWIPCSFLWLISIYEIHKLSTSTSMKIPWTWLNVTKTIVILIVIVLELAFDAVHIAETDASTIPSVGYYTAIIKVSSLALSLILHLAQRVCGLCSSGPSFFFWLLFTLYEAVVLRTVVKTENSGDTLYILTVLRCSFVFFQFFLNFWSDSTNQSIHGQHSSIEYTNKQPFPEDRASFPSQLVFNWVWQLLWKGYKKPLEFLDLWELGPSQKAEAQINDFERYSSRAENNERKGIFYNILKPLIYSYGLMFLWTTVLCTTAKVLAFMLPQILSLLITFTEEKENHQVWKGYFFAGLIFFGSFAQSVLTQTDLYNKLKLTISIKSMLSCAIYRKSLKVSSAGRKFSTTGEIVNLMSVDVMKIAIHTVWLNDMWDAPFQIVLATYFLYQELGMSIFVGVGVLFILIPANLLVTQKMQIYQKSQMVQKDKRVQLMNEIISGMKILKLYAWEPSFEQEVKNVRNCEISILKKKAILYSVVEFIWSCAPVLVALATFATYVLIDEHNVLDARKAFVSLALFNLLNEPATFLPMVFVKTIEVYVSLKRLNDFMNAEEIIPNGVTHSSSEPDTIMVKDADFEWNSESVTLRNINLSIKEGSLVAVVGTVGCGKSSVLSAILGEMKKTRGRVNVKGTVAYVPQQPWIQNNTLQDNIYFGRLADENKYNQVLNCCALRPDLDILPAGDQTEIGEKGINLSGGQKQRIALARAAYSNADVYLLDDPLSAVDAHVGKQIFDNLLGPSGTLNCKTRILVTHGLQFLPQVDQIFVMKDGEISEFGTYKELLAKKGAFSEFLLQYCNEINETANPELSKVLEDLENVYGNELNVRVVRTSESESLHPIISTALLTDEPPSEKDRLIEEENSETGNIKMAIILQYMKTMGWSVSLSVLIMYFVYQSLAVGCNIWLSKWTDQSSINGTESISERNKYLGVYGALGLAQCLSVLFIAVTISISTLIAARKFHHNMLSRVLRAPMMFFETTPVGRIVNRFSSDIQTIDEDLPYNVGATLDCFFKILAILFVISYSTPLFLLVAVGVTAIFVPIQRFYVKTARQLFRIDSVTKSPVFSHFTETLNGVSTIRAFSAQERFIEDSETKIDNSVSTYLHLMICRRWLAVSLEFLGALVVFCSALFCVLERKTLTPSMVGLSVSYALQLSSQLSWFIMVGAFLETSMVAVERICEYSDIIQEAEWVTDKKPAPKWPEKGEIKFENYETRYRDGLSVVLKDFTCKVKPGEKVGIVGRTGAGKSSITLGLFRIIEATKGRIVIDGENISELGLHDVRGRLTIIPQDPLLFTGTLRFNLDPFSAYDDDDIWKALENAHMKTFVLNLADGLQHKISEDGGNISVGQRQLVCLARAILRKSTILILDEATAAVDLGTDDLIQETIRKEFRNCTVLTIAHRLNTIMDSDRVMVLDKGAIVEFDEPNVLLTKSDSLFYQMSVDAGIVNS